jgi:hypothetical protein
VIFVTAISATNRVRIKSIKGRGFNRRSIWEARREGGRWARIGGGFINAAAIFRVKNKRVASKGADKNRCWLGAIEEKYINIINIPPI